MDYEPETPYRADSPLSYDVEEGELSSGSGRSSPGTIRDNASDCSTQTDDRFDNSQDRITTMRVEVECATSDQHTQTALNQPTPKEMAQVIKEQVTRKKQTENKRNQDSFYNRTNNNVTEQGTSTNVHSYQNNRPRNDGINNTPNTIYQSPPLPNYPPPVRPPPPNDNEHELPQYHVQQRLSNRYPSHRYPSHIKPNNLRFPYAVTPRSNSRKSFFHQQSPTTTVMETIWFQDKDPRTLNNPHKSNYKPLLGYRNWSEKPFDSRDYNLVLAPLHNLKDRVSEYFPPLPSENTNTVKRSTKNMGRDKYHQTAYPILKQFYSLTERFLYDYDYEFKIPITCTFDNLVAKASQDLSAYSVFDHQIFQLSFNFLHPTPKDVQNKNYRVHETKLVHNLIYYTFLRDRNKNTTKSYIHINGQLTSPYFLNYGYRLKLEYTIGTLCNFDPVKSYYIFKPKEAPERPLIVPIEALEPCEEYHIYHLEASVRNRAVLNRIQFNNERKTPDIEKEIRNSVKASKREVSLDEITDLVAYFLSKDFHFIKEYQQYRDRTNHPKQTEKI